MWFLYAIAASVFSVAGQLLIKKASGSPFQIACGIAISAGLFGLIGLIASLRDPIDKQWNVEVCVGLTGALFFMANIAWITAIQKSNNISLVRCVIGGIEFALLTALAYLLFKQSLSKKQVGGILLVVVGIALLV